MKRASDACIPRPWRQSAAPTRAWGFSLLSGCMWWVEDSWRCPLLIQRAFCVCRATLGASCGVWGFFCTAGCWCCHEAGSCWDAYQMRGLDGWAGGAGWLGFHKGCATESDHAVINKPWCLRCGSTLELELPFSWFLWLPDFAFAALQRRAQQLFCSVQSLPLRELFPTGSFLTLVTHLRATHIWAAGTTWAWGQSQRPALALASPSVLPQLA